MTTERLWYRSFKLDFVIYGTCDVAISRVELFGVGTGHTWDIWLMGGCLGKCIPQTWAGGGFKPGISRFPLQISNYCMMLS